MLTSGVNNVVTIILGGAIRTELDELRGGIVKVNTVWRITAREDNNKTKR